MKKILKFLAAAAFAVVVYQLVSLHRKRRKMVEIGQQISMPTELYKKVKGEIPEDIGVLLYYDGMSTCGIRKVKECKPHILSEKTQKWLIMSVAKKLPRFDMN